MCHSSCHAFAVLHVLGLKSEHALLQHLRSLERNSRTFKFAMNLLEGGHGRQWDVEFRVHALGERQTQFACLLQCCEEALACVLYRVVSGEHKGLECGQLGGMVGVVGGGCGGVLVCG